MEATAGPYLRYGNCLPGSTTWTASALFLTHSTSSSRTTPISPFVPGPDALPLPHQTQIGIHDQQTAHQSVPSSPHPVLILEDAGPFVTDKTPALPQHEVHAELLDVVDGWSFWRFDLEMKLGAAQRSVDYFIMPLGKKEGTVATRKFTFWLPPRGQPYHFSYYSCNGFSSDVPEDSFARKDPTYLWRDLLKVHETFPMHVIIGGGDQVYSDDIWEQHSILKVWTKEMKTPDQIDEPWTPELRTQATSFYLRNYIKNFTIPEVAAAYASIPSVMVYDDHDIFDGWGSYDEKLQTSPVFQGLFAAAERFYLLFQQHTTKKREARRPEFIPYDDGYHSVRYMGPQIALLAIDMRTQRTKKQILPTSSYQMIRNVGLELPESVEHVVVMSGVPLVFPTIPLSESILEGFKAMFQNSKCCRALGKKTGLMDRFGKPELLDDLLDGWVANAHKDERTLFIKTLQEIALKKNVRVTVLSGDAHVGGVGRLYSRPKRSPIDDPLYMAQIISSAIMNAPPPLQAVRMLLRTNFARNVSENTRQKMDRRFWPRHPRTDKLLARRNWCDITMTASPFTAPTNPSDPEFGGLRFSLRVEDPDKWLGYAEEVYDVLVPRFPTVSASVVAGKHEHNKHLHLHAVGGSEGSPHPPATPNVQAEQVY